MYPYNFSWEEALIIVENVLKKPSLIFSILSMFRRPLLTGMEHKPCVMIIFNYIKIHKIYWKSVLAVKFIFHFSLQCLFVENISPCNKYLVGYACDTYRKTNQKWEEK